MITPINISQIPLTHTLINNQPLSVTVIKRKQTQIQNPIPPRPPKSNSHLEKSEHYPPTPENP